MISKKKNLKKFLKVNCKILCICVCVFFFFFLSIYEVIFLYNLNFLISTLKKFPRTATATMIAMSRIAKLLAPLRRTHGHNVSLYIIFLGKMKS